jgi:FtsP/CotA-like multicopper oxidase with cupredoxin domain
MKKQGFLIGMGLLVALAVLSLGADQGWAQVDYTKPNYANSPIIRKFVDTLPGLTPAKKNNLGQYLPLAVADTTTYPGSDYYEIGLKDYTKRMSRDLPFTKIRGYYQINGTDHSTQYLGPIILATRDRPVRIKFSNRLGVGAAGNSFIPVDTTCMGAGTGPDGSMYTENRASVHLHGGIPPWISDGTPHQWITPIGETANLKKGPNVYPVPDMGSTPQGYQTFYWTNQQSGRLMFYHDHAFGITRLNVYAGEAAGYLIVDPNEETALQALGVPGTIITNPATGAIVSADLDHLIPLVIQDKSFVSDTTAVTDPLWDFVNWGGIGNLWFPHVYQPNQLASSAVNPLGRWDYGPWMWPPALATNPSPPHPSIVPEAFMDTPVVNGTCYPYMFVAPTAYRLRILNASNDRALNLQLYYADPANLTEVKMVPADGTLYPNVNQQPGEPATLAVPFDGRAGGVPDPTTAGPAMIQIGNEGGLLPAPAILPNTPIDYDYDRRSITFGSVRNTAIDGYPRVGYTLVLGPAERADVIVDFSLCPAGTNLILYNDAPAAFPAFDPRYDYYTGNPDLTASGGAPSTAVGMGPNTRTIMQFRVRNPGRTPAFNVAGLQAGLPAIFAASQPPPIVPLGTYGDNTLYGGLINQGINWDPFLWQGNTFQGYRIMSKSLSEDFDVTYGRMNARLGTEQSSIDTQGQQTLGMDYVQPPTEAFTENPADPFGTQIWMIVHNGVDTHFIHFHLFNVQVVNRVDWAGVIKPPDPNELGWKETVRMNPLENIILAIQPIKPVLPWDVPTCVRPLNPAMPITGLLGTAYNATTNPNPLTNYDWEYVWHCHLLGHEENDMMRPIMFVTVPFAPTLASASQVGTNQAVYVRWTDNSKNESGFKIQRATDAGFTTDVVDFTAPANNGTSTNWGGIGMRPRYADTTVTSGNTYYYRVLSTNQAGDSAWATAAPVTVN